MNSIRYSLEAEASGREAMTMDFEGISLPKEWNASILVREGSEGRSPEGRESCNAGIGR